MRILMIGGTRFIGAYVARRLHDEGNEITVFHRGRSANPVLPDVEHVLDPGAEYPVTDFPRPLHRDWDVIVHMVAMGKLDAAAAVRAFDGRTRRLVMISSCDVYRAYGRLTKLEFGAPEPLPLSESAPLRSVFFPCRGMVDQLGAFAEDYEKVLAEEQVRGGRGEWTILRLPKVYGREDNGDLSTIYDFASAPDWRWTHGHVENVAASIARGAIHPGARNEIFNVGEEVTPTMRERLARLPTRDGASPELPPFDYRQSIVIDTTKIRRRLGHSDVVDESRAMADLASRRS